MKKYEPMYSNTLTLREIFVPYCEHNGISVHMASKIIGVPWTTLSSWARGERGLRPKYANKVRDFLRGKYAITAEVIATWLENCKENTLTDRENAVE